ncbi:hypothetical protein FGO68_gene2760 [Halteria grandinella]|uniref:Uncharacterized protein n=1 Tax=Halteria grandinella TaxID=5974 RepID=A0A8J8NYX0_HALGN|nr:hypothetical protein FGO68_gene2760 [Halteria grandinella]
MSNSYSLEDLKQHLIQRIEEEAVNKIHELLLQEQHSQPSHHSSYILEKENTMESVPIMYQMVNSNGKGRQPFTRYEQADSLINSLKKSRETQKQQHQANMKVESREFIPEKLKQTISIPPQSGFQIPSPHNIRVPTFTQEQPRLPAKTVLTPADKEFLCKYRMLCQKGPRVVVEDSSPAKLEEQKPYNFIDFATTSAVSDVICFALDDDDDDKCSKDDIRRVLLSSFTHTKNSHHHSSIFGTSHD